jgi:hypothetical protein
MNKYIISSFKAIKNVWTIYETDSMTTAGLGVDLLVNELNKSKNYI